jgi:hypothetical protein
MEYAPASLISGAPNGPSIEARHREDWCNERRRQARASRAEKNPSLLSPEDWKAAELARWAGVRSG